MGREESKEQAKAAQREKEAAAHAKKQERKDKMWEKGAKDTSKADGEAAASAEAAERKAAAAAQVRVLVRLAVAADGAGACVDAPGLATPPCTLALALHWPDESAESPGRRLGRRRRRRARGAAIRRRRRRPAMR